jgi:hypothetical protein
VTKIMFIRITIFQMILNLLNAPFEKMLEYIDNSIDQTMHQIARYRKVSQFHPKPAALPDDVQMLENAIFHLTNLNRSVETRRDVVALFIKTMMTKHAHFSVISAITRELNTHDLLHHMFFND